MTDLSRSGFGVAGQESEKWPRSGPVPVLHVYRTMANWITVALIGSASAWAATGCKSSGVGPGESSDGGKPPGVCEGSTSTSPAATIHVTRSTNSPELTVAVYCDGSAERTLGEAGANNSLGVMPKTYEPSSPEVVEKFLTDLDAVGDVSLIPASPRTPIFRVTAQNLPRSGPSPRLLLKAKRAATCNASRTLRPRSQPWLPTAASWPRGRD